MTAPLSPQTAQIRLLRVLYEVAATPEAELNPMLHQVAQSLAEALNIEAVSIQLFDAKRNVARIAVEYPLNTVEGIKLPGLDNPVSATFVNSPQPKPFVLNDVNELPDGPVKEAVRQARIKSALIVPMYAQRTRVGSIALATRTEPRTFAPQEVEIIQAIVGQLAVSIYSAQLLAEVEKRARQAEQIADLGQRLAPLNDRLEIMRTAAAATPSLIPAEGISVSLHQPSAATIDLFLVEGARVLAPLQTPFEQSGLRVIYEKGQSTIATWLSSSTTSDYQVIARHALPGTPPCDPLLETALIVPLIVRGQTIGTFNLATSQADQYTDSEKATAESIAGQLAAALENARLFSQTMAELQTERLRAQLVVGENASDVNTLIVQTTRGIGQAIGAHRARVRLTLPPERSEN